MWQSWIDLIPIGHCSTIDFLDLGRFEIADVCHLFVEHQRENNRCNLVIYQIGGGRTQFRVGDLERAVFQGSQAKATGAFADVNMRDLARAPGVVTLRFQQSGVIERGRATILN